MRLPKRIKLPAAAKAAIHARTINHGELHSPTVSNNAIAAATAPAVAATATLTPEPAENFV